jgi:hypothetical protein
MKTCQVLIRRTDIGRIDRIIGLMGEDYNGLKKGSDWGAYHPFLSPIRCSAGLFRVIRMPLRGE